MAQVYDFIFNPKSIQKAQKDPQFRQLMVELSFNYVEQKYKHKLNPQFTLPKLSYKGATVQWQRIKAKKGPKIEEVELSEEEKRKFQEQSMAE